MYIRKPAARDRGKEFRSENNPMNEIQGEGPEPSSEGNPDPHERSRCAGHGGGCFPWCARPTGGNHGRTARGPAKRFEGQTRGPRQKWGKKGAANGHYRSRGPVRGPGPTENAPPALYSRSPWKRERSISLALRAASGSFSGAAPKNPTGSWSHRSGPNGPKQAHGMAS